MGAMAETEKFLSIVVGYDEGGVLFPDEAPVHVKEMFFDVLDRAGATCQAFAT